MKLFLDTSVLLAASGSATGASHAIIAFAKGNGWSLCTSTYCIAEAAANMNKLSPSGEAVWRGAILPALRILPDTVAFSRPLAFPKAKDKPVLVTALAHRCNYLLTLDRKDFGPLMNAPVYELRILTPGAFLKLQRSEGQLEE